MTDTIEQTPKPREKKAWQDVGNMTLGFWLTISPGTLKFASTGPAALSCVILGVLLITLTAWLFFSPRIWLEALVGVTGAMLVAAPWVAGFAAEQTPTANCAAVGIAVIAMAALRAFELNRRGHGGHDHGVAAAS